MAHEKMGSTVEELNLIAVMLQGRIERLHDQKALLEQELRLVVAKRDRLARGEHVAES